jgi:hypothetical protein
VIDSVFCSRAGGRRGKAEGLWVGHLSDKMVAITIIDPSTRRAFLGVACVRQKYTGTESGTALTK